MPGPILSAIASLILPGLGQILNKKFKRGIGLIGLWLITLVIVSIAAIFLVIFIHLIFMVATAFDAYRIVKRSSSEEMM